MTKTAPPTGNIVVERLMPHPPVKIWRALTQGPLLETWLMKNDFQPVVGHKFNFRAAPAPPHWNGVVDCEVLAVEPPRRLAYSWNGSGEQAETGPKTVVTWTLTPTKAGVLVRMEQSGFREDQAWNMQGAEYGWKRMIAKLDEIAGELD